MIWNVVYQTTPFSQTTARALIIEADGMEDAYMTAYDWLLRHGHVVITDDTHLGMLKLNISQLRNMGLPDKTPNTQVTIIRSIEPHTIKVTGRVLMED